MCFVVDADWYAEVSDDNGFRTDRPYRCVECRSPIPTGVFARYVRQQEHECCQDCDGDDPDCDHNYGETFEAVICQRCACFLEAIRRAEVESGCREYESQPALGQLFDSVHDAIFYGDGDKYLERFEQDFPREFAASRIVERLKQENEKGAALRGE